MLDQCASNYGWTIKHILSHSYHQIKHLNTQAVNRKKSEYEVLAGVFRMAQHADRNGFERFIEHFSSEDKGSGRKTVISQRDAPHGIRVKKE